MLNVENTLLALEKILKKVPNVCFVNNHNILIIINRKKIITKEVEFWIPKNFLFDLLKCIKNKKSTFYFLNIYSKNKLGGHANCLIFKYKNQNTIEIERYEPVGFNKVNFIVDTYLKKMLTHIFSDTEFNIVYYSPLNFCPIIGAQKHAKDNQYCIIFSAIYIYDRMINTSLSRKKIANLYIKMDSKVLLKQIKDFRKFLISKIKKEKIDLKNKKVLYLFKDYNIFKFK